MAVPAGRVPLAITGLGWVTALGSDVRTTWDALCDGRTGVRPITRFDASGYPAHVAAALPDMPFAGELPEGAPPDGARRGTRAFLAAAREAWADAAPGPGAARHCGVAVGVSANYLHHGWVREAWRWRDESGTHLDLQNALHDADLPAWHDERRKAHHAARLASMAFGLDGPAVTVDTACASSLHALREACRAIWSGRAERMLVGGAAAPLNPLTLVAFGRIGALSANGDPACASRPFDRARDGFVIGEGGGALVLEAADRARARGAHVYAEVWAVAATSNATSLTDPSPDGEAECRVMRDALAQAGLAPDQIDYVAAHGTSTPKNDETETRAIRRAFGPHASSLAVSSVKGQLGHTLSSAGVFNVMVAALAIDRECVPPTATLRTADASCDLDYVPGRARKQPVRAALANAFAFGGQNACAVLVAGRGSHPAAS